MSVHFVDHGSLRVQRTIDAQYETAKRYLCRDAGERALFARLERAGARRFTLLANNRNNDCFDPSTNTIAWDPYSALRTTRGGRQSPALGLGHEIDHAVCAPRREQALAGEPDARYDTAEERRVIVGSESHAARTLGESVRTNHDGTTYRVSSPIATDQRVFITA